MAWKELAKALIEDVTHCKVTGNVETWHQAGDRGVLYIAAPWQGLATVERTPQGYHLCLTSGGHSQHTDYLTFEDIKAVLSQKQQETLPRRLLMEHRQQDGTRPGGMLYGFWYVSRR